MSALLPIIAKTTLLFLLTLACFRLMGQYQEIIADRVDMRQDLRPPGLFRKRREQLIHHSPHPVIILKEVLLHMAAEALVEVNPLRDVKGMVHGDAGPVELPQDIHARMDLRSRRVGEIRVPRALVILRDLVPGLLVILRGATAAYTACSWRRLISFSVPCPGTRQI